MKGYEVGKLMSVESGHRNSVKWFVVYEIVGALLLTDNGYETTQGYRWTVSLTNRPIQWRARNSIQVRICFGV